MNMQHNVQVFKFIHSNLYFLVCCFYFFSLSLSLFKNEIERWHERFLQILPLVALHTTYICQIPTLLHFS